MFGGGSRTPIAITILVRKLNQTGKAKIMYHDIGDYLSRDDKLKIISDFHDVSKLPMEKISPNEHGDWISIRNDRFDTWIPIEADQKFNNNSKSFFLTYVVGVNTARDNWVYNFSQKSLHSNINKMVDFYNVQRNAYFDKIKDDSKLDLDTVLEKSDTRISWSRGIKKLVERNVEIEIKESDYYIGSYRPFTKQAMCYNDGVIEMPGLSKKIFPSEKHKNYLICIQSISSKQEFMPLITDSVPNFHFDGDTQGFPLYWYETINPDQSSLFADNDTQIVKHEAISNFILERAQSKYGNKVQREDIFYYVYGILHSKSYREMFEADLKKMLPRIPLVSDYQKFWDFSKAGRELANLHLNYEKVAAYPDVQVESLKMVHYEFSKTMYDIDDGTLMAAESTKKHASSKDDDYDYYAVQQMKFPKKGQKDTIIYNHYHTIKNIPEKAYEYVVNGKSAIEWIMERYAVTTDKKSGITNNPNDWALEHEQPRYIFDLLLSVINVSVQSVDIVNNLPEVDWDKE